MENVNLKERILAISGVNPRKCMKCGKCSGTCPNYDEMEYHPHQFVDMVEKGNIEPLMRTGSLLPTRNLEHVGDDCAGLHHLQQTETKTVRTILKNSFGFGGVNTALVIRAGGC